MEVFTLSIKKPDVRIHVAVNVLWIKEAQVEKLWSLCSVQHRGDLPVCCNPDVSHSIILSRSLCHIQTSKVALWDEQVHNQTFGICGHCSTSCGARSRCAKACALLIFSLLTRLTTLKNLVPGLVPEMAWLGVRLSSKTIHGTSTDILGFPITLLAAVWHAPETWSTLIVASLSLRVSMSLHNPKHWGLNLLFTVEMKEENDCGTWTVVVVGYFSMLLCHYLGDNLAAKLMDFCP